MNTTDINIGLKAGTAGGTILVILSSLGDDIYRTVLLSATGAAVSFAMSFLLKVICKHISQLLRRDE